ncbi:isoprenyl transferase [Reinekea sp.]|jgi:undecaprenyl diphosphate synthase|uniref:isoprenyl transferase n=1 Tax=Reinekea sp. TaxID=1970455 RepID=UPI002A83ACBB|nr:isoprenyl transferase [Reinekea sp.]
MLDKSTQDALTRSTEQAAPRHVAVIMDGNNRWAKKRLLGGIAGHKAGARAVRTVVETCARAGVEVLTLYAFSSENWRRPKDEVSALMDLFLMALNREVKKLANNNVRLRVIGDVTGFSASIQRAIVKAEQQTAHNSGMTLAIAANYGGHWDITQAVITLARRVKMGELEPEAITEALLGEHVMLGDLPPPDLCIRTAGEQRISNFLLWQMAYTEFYFTDEYWPDFNSASLLKAFSSFSGRTRRYGRTDEQLEQEK